MYKLFVFPKQIIDIIINFFTPFIRIINYKEFKVYYSKGTSLIEGIKNEKDKTYESEISEKLILELSKKKCPSLIDIGANIGLITINVISKIPNVKVFAFEPGPHQNALLKKTIKKNNLEKNVRLFDTALSYQEGYSNFFIHHTKHASGDGLIDTGRAGNSEIIKIQTTTLDMWWKINNNPPVDAIKIDVEGAELWILKGAEQLIKSLTPFIIMEFYTPHFEKYPFNEYDILNWFFQNGYVVYDSDDGQLLSIDNIHLHKNTLRDIYAYPTQFKP